MFSHVELIFGFPMNCRCTGIFCCRSLLSSTDILSVLGVALASDEPPVTAVTLSTALCSTPTGRDAVISSDLLEACLAQLFAPRTDPAEAVKVRVHLILGMHGLAATVRICLSYCVATL